MKRNLLLPMMLLVAGGVLGPSVKAQSWTGAEISTAKDKNVYLWNVGAKQFLGKGGRWGTEAVISNVGTPFKVVQSGSTYLLQSVVKAEGTSTTSTNGYLGFMNGVNSKHDAGNYFIDRDRSNSGDQSTSAFTFTGNAQGYTLQVTSSAGASGYQGTFCLFANMAGDGKAKGVNTIATDSTAYGQWIIVTEDERKRAFEKAEASSATAVPGTFLMFDQGFDRNDNQIGNWEVRKDKSSITFDDKLTNGTTNVIPSEAYSGTTQTYTYTYTGSHTYGWNNTHNVTYTVTTKTLPENMPQTLTIPCNMSTGWTWQHNTENVTVTLDATKTTSSKADNTPYTYYVGNGYADNEQTFIDEDSNVLSDFTHWQELYGGDWTANIHGSYGVVNQTIPNGNMIREGWYRVSCVGFTTATQGTAHLYASAGTASTLGENYQEADLKKISEAEQPATYVKASRLLERDGYEASVLVYVGRNENGNLKTLSFGVMVDDAQDKAWTCFDNFQIEYLGNPQTTLVLDEDQTSVEYIQAQVDGTEDSKTRTLYLHRTVNADKWNSIVLPVNLTVGQVKDAFGDNVHISEFKGATNKDIPGRMYFEPISADRNNNNEIAIRAGKLYIIKPTKSMPTGQAEISFPEATAIDKKLTSYFTFQQVTFDAKANDIQPKVEGETGDETYGSDTQVQFVGTYVANGENEKLIPAKSYVLRGNQGAEAGLWFYRTVATSTKGFRGWLETVNATNPSKISFSINGVVSEDEATGIDAVDAELKGDAVNGNIYNLSGQLVRRNATSLEGLAKGVYIHNGKKYIVK